MTIDFGTSIALWPAAQIKQQQDTYALYLVALENRHALDGIPALIEADDSASMVIIVAKVGASFFARVIDEAGQTVVGEQAISDAALIEQFNTGLGDSPPVEEPTREALLKVDDSQSQLKNHLINSLVASLSKQQDIFFQPGLTWTRRGGAQGVALLFLENYNDSGEVDNSDKQDFRELVKGLVRWVWAAAGKDEGTAVQPAEVEALYHEFATTALSYAHLTEFLSGHYRFAIQEFAGGQEMEGTVFPMFPGLEIAVGAQPAISFSPADKQLDAGDIDRLRAFFAQLKVRFETESSPARPTIEAGSVTEFLFVGYARLLIRTGLQAVIDHLKDNQTAPIAGLLDELPNTNYRNIANMASRFLLNGFNLPEDFFGEDDPTADEGLYVSTGQQYNFFDSRLQPEDEAEAVYQVTLQMGSGAEAFIHFPASSTGGKAHIDYTITIPGDDNHPLWVTGNALQALNDQSGREIKALLHSARPKPIPSYRTEKLHFALRNRVNWGDSNYLLPLPSALLNHLKQMTPNPIVDIRVWPDGNPANVVDVPNADFTWATRIDLTLQRVPNPAGDGFLKETYEIGSSSEQDKALLEAIWNFFSVYDLTLMTLDSTDALPVAGNGVVVVAKIGDSYHARIFNWRGDIVFGSGVDGFVPDTTLAQELEAAISSEELDAPAKRELGQKIRESLNHHIPENEALPVSFALTYILNVGGSTNPAVETLWSSTGDSAGSGSDMLLLKTNLSTETSGTPSTEFGARLSDGKVFLRLLWTALDVDSGGFFLHIPHGDDGLDTTMFKRSNSAVFPFWIVFTDARDPIYDFNNYAVLENAVKIRMGGEERGIDVATDLVLARSDQSMPILTIPPGFLGFQIDDRPEDRPGPNGRQIDGIEELKVLYQLLGWQVAENGPFKASNPGLPIGPTERPAANNVASGQWLYERLVPIFSLVASPPSSGLNDLPPQDRSPYLGISAESKLKVQSWWQDIYGNQLLDSLAEETFPIGYTDALMGINQWPSVSENYTFLRESEKVTLRLTFSFDTSSYSPAVHTAENSRLNRIQGDKAIITKAYYQLMQPDIDFTVGTSLDGSWTTGVEKAGILAFVASIYRYLDDSLNNLTPTVPAPYVQDIDASDLNINQAFIFPVRVDMEMTRDLELVSAGLKESGALKPQYENVWRAPARLSPKLESGTIIVTAGQSLADVADAVLRPSYSVVDLLLANTKHTALFNASTSLNPAALDPDLARLTIDSGDWEEYASLSPEPIEIQEGESPEMLARRVRADMETKLGRTVNFIVADLAVILADRRSLLAGEAEMAVGGLTMRSFAQNFQSAFPGLRLAVGDDRQDHGRSDIARQSLYAVRLGATGITCNIQEGQPIYYAIPPLSNVLLSGEVPVHDYARWKVQENVMTYRPESEISQFDAIDLNVLARDFLVALERFLNPATLVPAYRLFPLETGNILQQKAILAQVLSEDILPLLDKDKDKVNSPEFSEAKEAIRQALLVDLVNGYDIETIVQFDVDLTVAEAVATSDWQPGFEPRIRGKARVNGARVGEDPVRRVPVSLNTLDFTLSPGKIRLRPETGASYFTYLFDTRNPELFASLELDLEFVLTEIEYEIQQLEGITDRQASKFLNFVLSEGLSQSMGSSPIPIPLREYPTPPSLIQHQARPDPTSLASLADVRQWQYTIIYEHLDVSQDSIDCIVQLNVPPIDNPPPIGGGLSQPGPLFAALVNFAEIYPQIALDLDGLQRVELDPALEEKVRMALLAFETLVSDIATRWRSWQTDTKEYGAAGSDLHLVISEEALPNDERQGVVTVLKSVESRTGGPPIKPTLALPGHKEKEGVPPVSTGEKTTFVFEPDPEDRTFFGDSSIPDRKLSLENLDVLEHQNGWASVWLSRNKELIRTAADGPVATHPAFIFQTPAVRFSSMAIPLITNNEPWDIAVLASPDGTPQQRTLEEHLRILIATLFPTIEDAQYAVRLSCSYAFSLATGTGLNEDLVTMVPILLDVQILPEELRDTYAVDLSAEINLWLNDNRPSLEKASLVFSVDLFSKLEGHALSVPMLHITRLRLGFTQIRI